MAVTAEHHIRDPGSLRWRPAAALAMVSDARGEDGAVGHVEGVRPRLPRHGPEFSADRTFRIGSLSWLDEVATWRVARTRTPILNRP